MIYYEDLIGTPFKFGGRGPDYFDCWGLVMEMLKRIGIFPPDYGWHDEAAAIQAMMIGARQKHWQKAPMKQSAVLLFRVGRYVRHVGFAISATQFIHVWERSNGVVVENFSEDWNKRLVGCYEYIGSK